MFLDQAKWYLKQCQLATKKVHVMVGHNTPLQFLCCPMDWLQLAIEAESYSKNL